MVNLQALPKVGAAIGIQPGDRNVYVIDDDSDLRQSLHFLLATSRITAWPFASADDFFDHLPSLAPAPILLDIRMAGMNGLEVLGEFHTRTIVWPVIIMSAHGDIATAVHAMKLGAIEFLEKPFTPERLDAALALSFAALDNMEQSLAIKTSARERLDQLSSRETAVIGILIEGEQNKSVAHRLGLSVRTVEMHRKNALAKLALRSVAEVATLVATARPNSEPNIGKTAIA